jgi:hypothetical protein
MAKRQKKPRDPALLTPALKAAFDVATGDEASFDALLRKLK